MAMDPMDIFSIQENDQKAPHRGGQEMQQYGEKSKELVISLMIWTLKYSPDCQDSVQVLVCFKRMAQLSDSR